MAQRYFVCRAYLKYKGKLYTKGDILPETFTHHDKARSIYGSRIGVCEVEEEFTEDSLKVPSPITTPLSGETKEGTATENAGPDVPEEGDNADEVKGDLPLDVPPAKASDEIPETGSSTVASNFFFNLPTGTPT